MLKRLLPLFSIFALIFIMTVETAWLQGDLGSMNIMMLGMAYFFLVFGTFKLNNLDGFAKAYAMYDVVAKRSRTYAYAYPFIEIALGLAYLLWFGGIWRDIITFFVMSVSAYGVWKALQIKDEIPCACLGTVFKVPMTKVTLFENLVMAIMALYMIWSYAVTGSMTM